MKPETVLVGADGLLKLASFGFAKRLPEGRAFTLVGTPDYLAPEIITGRAHGVAVDVWALGVLLYELLVGHAPFSSDDVMATYQKIVACRPHPFPAGVPDPPRQLIRRLMQGSAAGRPQAAALLGEGSWLPAAAVGLVVPPELLRVAGPAPVHGPVGPPAPAEGPAAQDPDPFAGDPLWAEWLG